MAAGNVRIAFTMRTPGRMQSRLAEYRDATLRGVQREMGESMNRVYAVAYANTPVRTGKMQRSLRREMDQDRLGYAVGWSAVDFPARSKARSQTKQYTYSWPGGTLTIPGRFYPVFVVLGTRFMAGRDPVTPALLTERPTLLQNLTTVFKQAGNRAER